MDELLTETEKEIIHQYGVLYTRLINEVAADGPNRDGDAAELRALTHGLQNWVRAQGVARAYPELYRLLGGVVAGAGIEPATPGS